MLRLNIIGKIKGPCVLGAKLASCNSKLALSMLMSLLFISAS